MSFNSILNLNWKRNKEKEKKKKKNFFKDIFLSLKQFFFFF